MIYQPNADVVPSPRYDATPAQTRRTASRDIFSPRADNELRLWNRPKTPLLKSASGKIGG